MNGPQRPGGVSKAVLITGCSSGIGRAAAERLGRAGHTVYATARRLESIEDLEGYGCKTLSLDVQDEDSMSAAVQQVESAEGAVGALVNNAGYGLHGAVEETDLDDVRRQFETNLFGLARLTQMCLPGMRRQRWGKVVNVSSMGGILTFPGGGFYHASKHALEALSDALRFEVRPFGIDVAIVEPGLIKTSFGDTAIGTVGHPETQSGPYASFNEGLKEKIAGAYEGPMARFAIGPEAVAKAIEKAITARRSRTRYPVPQPLRVILPLRRILPDRAFDALLRTQYPSPRP
jgi:NAD(P)-dependent dehydrogenase (short-subunit alcohol dehydrogenase family)